MVRPPRRRAAKLTVAAWTVAPGGRAGDADALPGEGARSADLEGQARADVVEVRRTVEFGAGVDGVLAEVAPMLPNAVPVVA